MVPLKQPQNGTLKRLTCGSSQNGSSHCHSLAFLPSTEDRGLSFLGEPCFGWCPGKPKTRNPPSCFPLGRFPPPKPRHPRPSPARPFASWGCPGSPPRCPGAHPGAATRSAAAPQGCTRTPHWAPRRETRNDSTPAGGRWENMEK